MANVQKIVGTLFPLTALPGGTFVDGLAFLQWLRKTGQTGWQLLPLNETQLELGSSTKHVPSPYKGYGIGLSPRFLHASLADTLPTQKQKQDFILQMSDWIDDYALFCSLRDYFKTDDWRIWENQGLRRRDKKALREWLEKLKDEIDGHIVMQWRLHQSYSLLKKKASEYNISLIGDIPFYISIQSPLVWAHQEIFQIEKDGGMHSVSGMPDGPSAFFGRQIWGHPLYKWEGKGQQESVISFWKMRLRYLAKLFHSIRIDYAKGFVEYGVIDTKNKDNDGFREGPGFDVIKDLVEFCKDKGLWIYAEDNGQNIEELRKFLQMLKIPGIKIYRFALDEKKVIINKGYAAISHYPQNSVAYTTSHDTDTLMGYLEKLTADQKKKLSVASEILYSSDDKKLAKQIRNALLFSPARMVIIPIQDWLLTKDRINVPGTEKEVNDPNWEYILDIPIEELPTGF